MEKKKYTLEEAVEIALKKENKIASVCGIVDCNRGYRNPYDAVNSPDMHEAYNKAVEGFKHQRMKIKILVKKFFKNKTV